MTKEEIDETQILREIFKSRLFEEDKSIEYNIYDIHWLMSLIDESLHEGVQV